MKRDPLFLAGLLGALALSWGVLVVFAGRPLARTPQVYDPIEGAHFPQPPAGVVTEGLEVYRSLGCSTCHTQQVRRPGRGLEEDRARGWGERPSLVHDTLFQAEPPLGRLRRGPDLANYGLRAARDHVDRGRLLVLLHEGVPGMPAHAYLFEELPLEGPRSPRALSVDSAARTQLLPSARAEALVAYLLSLRQDYAYPGDAPPKPIDPVAFGRRQYMNACVTCHQPTGMGTPGQYPQLAGSEWVNGAEERVILVLLHGLTGPTTVVGQQYSGTIQMPVFGKGGSYNWRDDQIAAVLTYIRQEWGNKAPAVTPEKVAELRLRFARTKPWTAAELEKLP